MKVLVCGSREWRDGGAIYRRLALLPLGSIIIEGGAHGADALARSAGEALRLKVREFPADWRKHGRAAGPIRNRKMLDLAPDLVIAFHEDLENSKGTLDCVTEARKRGIPVEVVGKTDDPLCVCAHKRSQHAYGSRDSAFYGRPPAACLHTQRTPYGHDICKCETYTEAKAAENGGGSEAL